MRSLRQFAPWLMEFGVLGVAAACGGAAVAAQGGRWNDRLDLLTHVTLVWLAGGLVTLVLAIFLRPSWRKVAAIGFALVAVISAGAIVAPDAVQFAKPRARLSTQKNLKLIEFNAWGRNADPARVAQWLAQEDPDVAVIIEGSALMKSQIAGATGMNAFEGSGALIFTREKPIAEWVAWGTRELPGESTEITWVDLPGPDGQPFSVIGLHLGWPIPSRHAWGQGRKIAAVLQTLDRRRAIMTGDFNSTQWSFRQRAVDASFALERRDHLIPTWPARLPLGRGVPFPVPFMGIDHAYAGRYWKTVSIARGPRMGSDHYPLIMTFAWAPPPPKRTRN
jgi:endonuclease/exonuclease/phosphatase (EEP) superfamily protein YafD